jgi:hypothetical protein
MPVKLDAHPGGKMGAQPIVYADIVTLIKNYKDNMPATPQPDATSAWVSIYELFSLISDNAANGIRIYYGRHDPKDAKYPNEHGVVLVATRDTVNPQAPTTGNSVDLLNYTAANGPVNSVSYSGDGDDAIPLCPPNCPPVHL